LAKEVLAKNQHYSGISQMQPEVPAQAAEQAI
jgi:hypothetical protein